MAARAELDILEWHLQRVKLRLVATTPAGKAQVSGMLPLFPTIVFSFFRCAGRWVGYDGSDSPEPGTRNYSGCN